MQVTQLETPNQPQSEDQMEVVLINEEGTVERAQVPKPLKVESTILRGAEVATFYGSEVCKASED